MENKLFYITRKFVFIIAVLLLLAAIAISFSSLMMFTSSANEVIKTPKVEPESYFKKFESKKEQKEVQTAPKNQATKVEEVQSKVDAEAEKAAVAVTKNLNICLTKVLKQENQEYDPTRIKNLFEKRYSKAIINISDEDKAIEFFRSISNDSENVIKNCQLYKKQKGFEPLGYIEWYFDEYLSQLNAEHERVLKEKSKALTDHEEAFSYIFAAGAVFGVFVILVIILVLFKIEINTRKERV